MQTNHNNYSMKDKIRPSLVHLSENRPFHQEKEEFLFFFEQPFSLLLSRLPFLCK